MKCVRIIASSSGEGNLAAFVLCEGCEWMQNIGRNQISFEELAEKTYSDENTEEYSAFVEKFKPKRTTDDCFTPPNIYEAVRAFVFEEYGLSDGVRVMRPFYPCGDFENEDYSGDCVVIDNPPFSILARIIKFYMNKGVRFFLFAPALTLFTCGYISGVNFVVCGVTITYANGAKVDTSFVTNLGSDKIYCCSWLNRRISEIDRINRKQITNKPPVYSYPHYVVNAARLSYIANHGTDLRIRERDTAFIRKIDSQSKRGKAVFGGGFLLSEKAAAEKAAAEKAAAEKAAAEKAAAEKAAAERANAIIWELSEREIKIIRELG